MVLIVPALVLMLGLMIAGGRLWAARTTVTDAAYSGARAASLARNAGQADTDGRQAMLDQLQTRGVTCQSRSATVDTSAFVVPVGQPATVRSHLDCRIGFSDVLLPGMPGSLLISADGQSALDTYRER